MQVVERQWWLTINNRQVFMGMQPNRTKRGDCQRLPLLVRAVLPEGSADSCEHENDCEAGSKGDSAETDG